MAKPINAIAPTAMRTPEGRIPLCESAAGFSAELLGFEVPAMIFLAELGWKPYPTRRQPSTLPDDTTKFLLGTYRRAT
jgi:hypothetical protein